MNLGNLYKKIDNAAHDFFRKSFSKKYSIAQLKYAKNVNMNWKKLTKEQKKEIVSYWGLKHPVKSDFMTHEIMLNVHNKFDVRYCPEKVFRLYLDPTFSSRDLSFAWDDKNYFDFYKIPLKFPKTLIRNVNGYFLDENYCHIDIDEVRKVIKDNLPLIIKPSLISGEGKNLKLISTFEEADAIFKDYKKDFLIQTVIEQCDEFKKMSSRCVNAMRVVTAIVDGKAKLLSSMLLCNTTDEIACNKNVSLGVGVVIIGIDENGKLFENGYYENTKMVKVLPNGFNFQGLQIPSYKKAIELALKAHETMPMLGILGWDITIDKDNNPVFIEWNLKGIGMYHSQLTTGPLFGEYSQHFADISKNLIKNWKKR